MFLLYSITYNAVNIMYMFSANNRFSNIMFIIINSTLIRYYNCSLVWCWKRRGITRKITSFGNTFFSTIISNIRINSIT